MRAAIFLAHIMDIVGRQQLDAKFVGPGHKLFVDRAQLFDAVLLQLDKEVLFAKGLDIPAQPLVRLFLFAL
ncbi:MAG: hypothetical protein DCC55_33435, partial [Chloroflexi bacterium]